jgi:hypothetical protein
MTKIELTKEIIKEKFIRPDNNLNTRAFHLYTIDGISKINKHQITKVWLNLTEIPVCKECKKETQYISYKEGYRNFCSYKCLLMISREKFSLTENGCKFWLQNLSKKK